MNKHSVEHYSGIDTARWVTKSYLRDDTKGLPDDLLSDEVVPCKIQAPPPVTDPEVLATFGELAVDGPIDDVSDSHKFYTGPVRRVLESGQLEPVNPCTVPGTTQELLDDAIVIYREHRPAEKSAVSDVERYLNAMKSVD